MTTTSVGGHGFAYADDSSNRSSFATTAGGICGSRACGGSPEKNRLAAGVLLLNYDRTPAVENHCFTYWGHYYAVAAMQWIGGEEWDDDHAKITRDLTKAQQRDGRWLNWVGPGDAFATAIACIVLQAPGQHLKRSK
jgi:hypothetical protein